MNTPPATEIGVQVGATLGAVAALDSDELAAAIAREVDAVLDALGIPSRAIVTATVAPRDADVATPLLQMTIGRSRARWPEELLDRVVESVLETHLRTRLGFAAGVAALRERADAAATLRAVARLCGEIAKLHPGQLFDGPGAAAVSERLRANGSLPADAWPPDRLAAVLRPALEQWMSIGDTERLATALAEADDDPAETVISALRRDMVDIELAPKTLRAMTCVPHEEPWQTFTEARDVLHAHPSLRLPPCRFVPAEDLGPLELRFRINALRTAPVMGVPAGSVIVNSDPEHLIDRGYDVVAATNIATGLEAALVEADDGAELANEGWIVRDPWAYLGAALVATLRLHGHRLLTAADVAEDLDLIALAFPKLVEAAREAMPVGELARLERALLREEMSIGDLPRILAAVADVRDPAFRLGPGTEAEGDSDPETVVRRALSRRLHALVAQPGTDAVALYATDVDVAMLLAGEHLSDDDRDRVVRAVKRHMAEVPSTEALPVVVTDAHTRAAFVEALRDELPRVRVLAWRELMPHADLDFRGNISLSD